MSVLAPTQVIYTVGDSESMSGWVDAASINHPAAMSAEPDDVGATTPQGNDTPNATSCIQPGTSSDSGQVDDPSQAATVPTDTPPTIPPPTEPSDAVWQDFVAVPGSKKGNKIFFRAPVRYGPWSQELCHERFAFVRDKLVYLVKQHFKLHGLERCPTYASRMTGTCPSTARPSIVVTCQTQDRESLQKLFRTKAGKQLFISDDESIRQQIKRLFRTQQSDNSVVPRLNIVYYAIPGSTVTRTASGEPVEAYLRNGESCGGLVRSRENFATLGVTIDIDDLTATITVNHLFGPEGSGLWSTVHPQTDHSGSSDTASASFAEPGSDCDFWSDDDEYDDEDIMTPYMDSVRLFSNLPARFKIETDDPDPWVRVVPPRGPQYPETLLDWALVEPSATNTKRNNRGNRLAGFNDRETSSELCKVRREPPRHLSPVLLVSGLRPGGTVRGQILAQPSFVPSFPDGGYFEAWTVILDEDLDLLSGESGSLVIDEATHEVYGHVVGRDPSGHVYVVRLTHVLGQIKECFDAYRIALSKPEPVLFETSAAHSVEKTLAWPMLTPESVSNDQKHHNFPAHSEKQAPLLSSVDDWENRKLERLAKEYMNMRKEIWQGLAARTGEKWNVVESKCMFHGLKNLQSAARAAARRERLESGQLLPPGYDNDSGISGIGSTSVDDLDASCSSPETKARQP